MSYSLHSSLIATASGNEIFIWEYEHLKLIGACTNKGHDVTYLKFIEPYPLLISLDNSYQVTFWNVEKSHSFVFYKPMMAIHLIGVNNNVMMQN